MICHFNKETKISYPEKGMNLGNDPYAALPLIEACTEDVERILSIIAQAQARMRAAGSAQWQDGYPAREHILADIARGYGRVLLHSGSVAVYGAVVFDGEPAYRELEGAWLTDGPYVAVHRLAVADETLGRGLATRFMLATEALARSRDVGSFRVDTNFDNRRMLRLLAKLGFVRCGEVLYRGAPRIAFEKIL